MKGILSNWVYFVWACVYVLLLWVILGCTLYGFLWSLGIYAVSIAVALSPLGESLMRKLENVKPIVTNKEKERLLPLFHEVYQNALKETPSLSKNIELCISNDMTVNAFAFGSNTVVLNRGTIESMSDEEIKGVLAHEFGHLAHHDTKALLINVIGNGLFSLVIMIINGIITAYNIITNLFRPGHDSIWIMSLLQGLINFIVTVIMGFGSIILSANSRQNEFHADNYASKIGYRENLIEALYFLSKFDMEGKISFKDKMKMSHPYINERIGRLENEQLTA